MPEKIVDENFTQQTFQFPQKPKKRTLKTFFYNAEKHTVMGRTKRSWILLVVFYFWYFVILGSLCYICLEALWSTISDKYPKYKLADSLIGTSPGMGYRPMPNFTQDAALLQYNSTNATQVEFWVNEINTFLQPYQNRSLLKNFGRNQAVCDFHHPPAYGNVCAFDTKVLNPCTSENGYFFNTSAPCFILKLNKIYEWVPEPYNNVDDLPSNMPTDLVEHIKSLPEEQRNQVWVSCNSLLHKDAEGIGSMEFYPSRGFPTYYYPYLNLPGYLSPLIAVRFTRPAVNRMVSIECRAWAKNIAYTGGHRHRQGSFTFNLHIEN